MSDSAGTRSYVTVEVGGQIFGIAIERVREVFLPDRLTHVPLAPPDVAGVLNLRGRIVTAIDMRLRLSLPPRASDQRPMAIGIDHKQEAFALLVDSVGDVLDLCESQRETTPATLAPRWASVAECVHRLDGRLLLVLDVDRALEPPAAAAIAA
ncbi:chemotaxis protein CheW [Hansschlegelia beijingensis]|uniref:Purine-binding chemotaxis protein CheW n=1 Tax=Hansschlegelia beijingensis TaxID=1133344 RepID=A0A7W6D5M3_9HYPH|nr:chemotaxis protein CheW [Hansschlegelia beijingensis]MBB3973573.1 purine-binding chemotaxis protein CheW [Hansschlegelia beijingensis]